jgi:arylsulfatase A-like enzyme
MADSRHGAVNDAMTLNVDIAPTILSVAGIKPPERMQGADLSPLYLSEDTSDWRTEFFYEHPMHRSNDFIPASEALVREDWKYMFWPEYGVEQFFDLKKDPIEENDLIKNPEYATRIEEMRTRFAELKAAAK